MNKILTSVFATTIALAASAYSSVSSAQLTFPDWGSLGTSKSDGTTVRKPDFEGFVQLQNGLKVFVIQYAAQPGSPNVVLLNGLTYDTEPWQKMASALVKTGMGVMLYDPRGMGKTLEENGQVKDIIPIAQQVEDLDLLLRDRGFATVDLAGLSYGGALGVAYAQAHPERVGKLVLMSPFVKPLEQQDTQIKQKIALQRMIKPSDKRSDDELYDAFLKDIVFQTYPLFEPSIRKHPWRLEAVYNLVRGVRKFLSAEAVKTMAAIPVHLVIAGKDEYVPLKDHNEFWNALRPDQKASRIVLRGSKHKIPEEVPNFMAGWLSHIEAGDAAISGGREFDGNPALGTATARDAKINELPIDPARGLF